MKVEMPAVTPLVCAECGRSSSGDASGWQARLGGGYDGELTEALIFCPECAEREFRWQD